MVKRSKRDLAELDAAIDQLGGGVAPIPRPAKKRSVATTKRRARTTTVRSGKKR